MQITVTDQTAGPEADCLVLPVFRDALEGPGNLLDSEAEVAFLDAASAAHFTGRENECLWLPMASGGCRSTLAVGLGKREKADSNILRQALGNALTPFRDRKLRTIVLDASECASPEAGVEACILGDYTYDRFKSPDEDGDDRIESLTVYVTEGLGEAREACRRSQIMCESANWTRDLVTAPGSVMTPSVLASEAESMAEQVGCEIEVLDERQMAELGMGCILGVSRGSDEGARLIVTQYTHAEARETIALVGKGITFDSGGLGLKSAANMLTMKTDMAGGASVLGAMRAVGLLKPKLNVACVVPASENLPDGRAFKPGDILTAHNGKTVEIGSTDAEGRLLLADALSYAADRFEPDAMVDLATLTGACVTALGHSIAAILSTDDELVEELVSAGQETHERLWRMPMMDEFNQMLKGTLADLSNKAPADVGASTVIGGAFLSHFACMGAWAHIDIAGKALGMSNASYLDQKLASGFGVRLLAQWLMARAAKS